MDLGKAELFLKENPDLARDSKYARSGPLGNAATNIMSFYKIEPGEMVDLLLDFAAWIDNQEDEDLALELVEFAERRYNPPKKRGRS